MQPVAVELVAGVPQLAGPVGPVEVAPYHLEIVETHTPVDDILNGYVAGVGHILQHPAAGSLGFVAQALEGGCIADKCLGLLRHIVLNDGDGVLHACRAQRGREDHRLAEVYHAAACGSHLGALVDGVDSLHGRYVGVLGNKALDCAGHIVDGRCIFAVKNKGEELHVVVFHTHGVGVGDVAVHHAYGAGNSAVEARAGRIVAGGARAQGDGVDSEVGEVYIGGDVDGYSMSVVVDHAGKTGDSDGLYAGVAVETEVRPVVVACPQQQRCREDHQGVYGVYCCFHCVACVLFTSCLCSACSGRWRRSAVRTEWADTRFCWV